MSTVAFIGLGNMGTPMSQRLIGAGHRVVGFDPVPAARDRLAAVGGDVAASAPEAAAQADAIILMLPNSDVVETVIDELVTARAVAPETLVIDMSSSEPLRTRALHDRLSDSGIRLADAPVSGGVGGAERGALTIMLGADVDDRAQLHELLAPMGTVHDCGEVGAGHTIKALNNFMSAAHLWASSEAMLVAKKFGLDLEVMLNVVNGSSGRSGSTQHKWPNFILPETYDSGFALRLMLKDMRTAAALADELDADFALGTEAIALWSKAADDLPADADHTRIAQWIAAQSVSADAAGEPGEVGEVPATPPRVATGS